MTKVWQKNYETQANRKKEESRPKNRWLDPVSYTHLDVYKRQHTHTHTHYSASIFFASGLHWPLTCVSPHPSIWLKGLVLLGKSQTTRKQIVVFWACPPTCILPHFVQTVIMHEYFSQFRKRRISIVLYVSMRFFAFHGWLCHVDFRATNLPAVSA